MSEPAAPGDRTATWRACNAALRQRGSLLVWFDPETDWLASPRGRRARPATFSDAAIQTCLTLKALFGRPLRQIEPSRRHRSEPDGEGDWWRVS